MSKLLKTLTTIILALMLSTALIACDDGGDDGNDATVTGEFVYELETGEDDNGDEYDYYKITGYTVTSEDALKMAEGDFSSFTDAQRKIKIPATYKNLPVEEIASMAFSDQVILTSVDFEGSNVKKIGVGAFSGCTSLTEIKNLPFIGASSEAVGAERVLGHLFGASSLSDKNTEVTAKVYYEVEEADTTFNVPTSLKKVSTTVTEIPECAFYGLSMLEEVSYPNATEIGKGAFSGCSVMLTADLSKVVYIYDGAFENCTALQEVNLSQNTVLLHVGDNAFMGCSRLGYNFVISDETALTVSLPDTVTYLGANAFKDCSTLKYVVLGSGIAEVKTGTFSGCSELAKVTIKNASVVVRASSFVDVNEKVKIYKADGVTEITLQNEAYGKPTKA
ncbi:MAG: leucine-rich repeat domain-containing protein [Clostridia bacterium]|nr:leucine-rich repeat domain-containing protein [Clostridia bacterium]